MMWTCFGHSTLLDVWEEETEKQQEHKRNSWKFCAQEDHCKVNRVWTLVVEFGWHKWLILLAGFHFLLNAHPNMS